MRTGWRICKAKHAATAFDGYGARRFGGRWNSPGVAMVYTASVAAQAMLEMLVHADATLVSLSYVLIPVRFDDALLTRVDPATLPSTWATHERVTRKVGDGWIAAAASAVLAVPSAILNTDDNYLLNPAHPDFPKLEIGKPEDLAIDERIRRLFNKP